MTFIEFALATPYRSFSNWACGHQWLHLSLAFCL